MPLFLKTKSPKLWKSKPYPKNKGRIKFLLLYLLQKMIDKVSFMITAFKFSSNQRKSKILKKVFFYGTLFFLILFFAAGIAGLAAFAWFSRDLPNPEKILERQIVQSTKIYDRTGQIVLYEIFGDQKRTLIELDQIPEKVKWATIVIEDKDFYKHHGFDLRGILRALWVNLVKGGKVQGGSTITQQFIKNSILSSEKTYTRKIKELVLSYQLERKFTKDQILKMYFNEIPYGSTAYGIQSAAKTFFGKDAKDLDLAEGALLAALPKAPTYYSPYGSHKDELLARQKYILDLMAEQNYITKEEAEQAKNIDIMSRIIPRRENILAPHFVMYVKEILTEKYGERMVEQGGLKVYTTLDFEKQKIAEEVIREGVEKNTEKYNAKNAALVALNPKTGEILAMVGSKDYFDLENDGNVNVTIRPRQPGSSFKPIVYAAAFAKGFTPETILFDVVTVFKTETKDYIPHNYDGKEHGPVTMRAALAGSLNIPAVKTLYLTGIDNVLDLAQKLGYTTLNDRSRFGLSLVLGGAEVKLLEHTAAFGAFANEGTFVKPRAIIKIEDANGKIIEELKPEEKKVLDVQIARQITDILSDNAARSFIFGTKNSLVLPGRPVAAKTGTTNDWRDGWTIGYTPSLVAGIWAGNNDNSEMKRGADGIYVAAPIWNAFMRKALAESEVENFTPPLPSDATKPILNGKIEGETVVKIDKASGKLATEFTPPTFIEEKIYREIHNILHYVNKDNPRGPYPENPTTDPQYTNWEEAVQRWAKEQNYTTEKPPTEYDDLHVPANQPTINIISPENDATVTNRNIAVTVQASAPRGISKVEYFIDDKLIKTSFIYPFSLNFAIPNSIENGFHTLVAKAYDDIDNSNVAQINFNLLAPKLPPSISWLSPRDNASFYSSFFPLTLEILASDPSEIAEIHFYYDKGGTPKLIDAVFDIENNPFFIKWQNAPESKGTYELYAEIVARDGTIYPSQKISITIL